MTDPMDRVRVDAWDTAPQRAIWPIRLAGGALAVAGLLLFAALVTYDAREVGWAALRPTGVEAKVGCSNGLGVAGLYTAAILYWLLGAAAPYGALLMQAPAWGMALYPTEQRRGQWIAFATMLMTASLAVAVQPWAFEGWTQQLGLRSTGGWFGFLGGTCVLQRLMGVYWTLELLIITHAVALIYLARLTPKSLYRAEKQEINEWFNRWREKRRLAREQKEKEALAWRINSDQEPLPSAAGGNIQGRLPVRMPEPQPEPVKPAPQPSVSPLPDLAQRHEASVERSSSPPVRKNAPRPIGENLLDLNDQSDEEVERHFNPLPRESGHGEEDEIGPSINEHTVRSIETHFGNKTPKRKTSPRITSPAKATKEAKPRARRPGDANPPEQYPLPPYELLNYEAVPETVREQAHEEMQKTQAIIIDTLESFNIAVQGGNITRGPSVTRYEFSVPRGQSVKAVAGKSKDIMAVTESASVNILAPIPGKSTVGVELENSVKEPVYLRELLQSREFHDPKLRIPMALGKDVYGNPVIGDLAAMPHVLVAGSTGSGKSVCINSMLVSFLYKFRPDELRLVLVDPKVVEMQPYKKLPHLAVPVVTDPTRVIGALRWAVNEMEHRYKLFSKMGVRNLEDYNNLPPDAQPVDAGEEEIYGKENPDAADAIVRDVEESQGADLGPDDGQEELDFEDDGPLPSHLPYIVIVIDELADLMMQVKQDLEIYIGRLTQKARAAGLHLIVATQSPRAQVVTGIIKTNLPSRIALKVSSQLDSRVILDEGGAENLLGKGDLLFLPPGGPSKMVRAQGAFVSDAEIASIIHHCASHARQNFVQSAADAINNAESSTSDSAKSSSRSGSGSDEDEELYARCLSLVVTERKASTSLLQRRFSIGYSKAAKIMDMLEARGVISPQQGNTNRPREVLIQ